MSMKCRLWVLACFCAPLAVALFSAESQAQAGRDRLPAVGIEPGTPKSEEKKVPWNTAEFVFSAKLVRVERGPVARSFPPIYNDKLVLHVQSVLRGELEVGAEVEAFHSARQHEPPTYPEGKPCLVAASKSRDRLRVDRIEAANDQQLKNATLQCQLPLGWTIRDGSVVSPWAGMGEAAWTAELPGDDAAVHCRWTGRPALLAGAGIRFDVAPVPPAEEIKVNRSLQAGCCHHGHRRGVVRLALEVFEVLLRQDFA